MRLGPPPSLLALARPLPLLRMGGGRWWAIQRSLGWLGDLALDGSAECGPQFLAADAAQMKQAASHFLPASNAVWSIDDRMQIPVERCSIVLFGDEPGRSLPDSCNRLASLKN